MTHPNCQRDKIRWQKGGGFLRTFYLCSLNGRLGWSIRSFSANWITNFTILNGKTLSTLQQSVRLSDRYRYPNKPGWHPDPHNPRRLGNPLQHSPLGRATRLHHTQLQRSALPSLHAKHCGRGASGISSWAVQLFARPLTHADGSRSTHLPSGT